jgi:nucleoside-diphosphate-sugar epimerase
LTVRVIVTGANGYVARHLIQELEKEDHYVIRASRSSSNKIPKNQQIIYQDIQAVDWKQHLENVDVIIHLAGMAHNNTASFSDFMNLNVHVTEKICKAAIQQKVKSFIFISSAAVFGANHNSSVIDEESVLKPQTKNGKTKLLAEQKLKALTNSAIKTKILILRVPMVYGPKCPGNMQKLIKIVSIGMPLPLLGAKNRRSFIYIKNLTSALCRVVMTTRQEQPLEIYTLADAEHSSTFDIVTKIKEVLFVPTLLFWAPKLLIKTFLLIIGQYHYFNSIFEDFRISSAKFKRNYDWVPPFPSDAAIVETIRSFRESRNKAPRK